MELGIPLDPNFGQTMKTDFLIIGGGIAGLSAANRLAEKGADVALLEAGAYPAQKICGEFLSPEAIPILQKWDIGTASSISTITLAALNRSYSMELPQQAATISRYTLDEALAKRAALHGVHIETGAKVDNVEIPKSAGGHFTVTLASGIRWTSPTLLVSTGRLMCAPPKFCYIGAKAHFDGINLSNELVMHLLPGAYFGMAPIAAGQVNVAGIIACTPEQALDPKATLNSFFQRTRILSEELRLFPDWFMGPVPEFGIRDCPRWPNTFFLGDAAGVIPPATGNGLSMGLTSGILAADYALKGDYLTYRTRWHKEYAHRIFKGKLLHKLFLSSFTNVIPIACSLFPSLPRAIFRATRSG